ncbi:MAG: hypothetical protein K1V99_03110 [Bacteroidales bacterium]
MKQTDKKARKEYCQTVFDLPTKVMIPGTNKTVKLRGIKPYTIERLTLLWLKREDLSAGIDSASTMKSLCIEPYFSVKEALLFVLNDYWKINLFLRPMTWWWGKVKGYTEEQMSPIILEGKKKLPLMAHWTNMACSADMRTDWMKMTKKEAEQYRAELLSVANQLSSRNFHAMEGQEDTSSVS